MVQQSGAELEGLIKEKQTNSRASGKTYRRSRISKPVGKSGKLPVKGLRTFKTKKGNKRVVTGYNFHRASAPGEAPAPDSGGLENATRSKKTGLMRNRVSNSKNFAAALDKGTNKAGRNKKTKIAARPFFESTAKEFKPKFLQNAENAIKSSK